MRRSLIAVASVAAMVASMSGALAWAEDTGGGSSNRAGAAAGPTADQLRDAVKGCDTQLSNGEYSEDEDGSADIPVCQSSGGAVHWKADMDVDCDGQRTEQCNEDTDPSWQNETSFQQSDGEPLNAAQLPFYVIPLQSDTWNYEDAGIEAGTVAAVVYQDKVVYAVFGDQGPDSIIGEGSYALADALGIDPDPATGGVEGKAVDYILFPGVTADPIEDHDNADAVGTDAANKLVNA